jgi:DNA-directed RNA polymerase specialized sigma24 family protein
MLKSNATAADHERLFIERFGRLRAAAMRLTSGHRDRAEELVQDAFIQFTLTSPDLEGVQNLDAYLYGVLRKLHLSQARRAARAPEVPLDAVDYDLGEWSLRQADARARRHVIGELAAVCAYACERKRTSKAASVLILRFFHGFYPGEIARILRIDVRAVDEWRRIARREAKAAIATRAGAYGELPAPAAGDSIPEFRAVIFQSRSGPCLTPAQLKAYGAAPLRERLGKVLPLPRTPVRQKSDVDCTLAAHIVSCEPCLDRICERLGIPSLSERSAEDNVGPGSRQDPPLPPDHGGPSEPAIRAAMRRGRQTFEHRPEQLHIAVNGLPLVWQSISSEAINQHVTVTTHEPIEFVEVFSEQGVRLLFLNARPPADDGPVQSIEVGLSDGRRLAAQISFAGTWPTIHLTYVDPNASFEDATANDPAAERQLSCSTGDESKERSVAPGRWWRLVFVVALAIGLSAAVFAEPVRSTLISVVQQIDRIVHEWFNGKPGDVRRGVDVQDSVSPTPNVSGLDRSAANASARSRLAPVPTFADLAAVEIDVLGRLDGIGAFLGERVTVSRNERRVLVEGVAETTARRAQIAAALKPLMTAATLQVRISSVSERLQRSPPVSLESVTIREVYVTNGTFPAQASVHTYLSARGEPHATLGDRARELASRMVDRSSEALAEAWAMQRLANRFSPDEQNMLTARNHAAWWRLVEGHARRVGELTASLRQELESVFEVALPDSEFPSALNGTASDSAPDAVDALVARVLAHNQAIRAAFTTRDTPTGSGGTFDVGLLRSMREAERSVERLTRARRAPTQPPSGGVRQ